MDCPVCHKDVSKVFNQFGIVKTCPSCQGKFKIKFKVKEILIYALIVGLICGIAGLVVKNDYLSIFIIAASMPFALNKIYKLEAVR